MILWHCEWECHFCFVVGSQIDCCYPGLSEGPNSHPPILPVTCVCTQLSTGDRRRGVHQHITGLGCFVHFEYGLIHFTLFVHSQYMSESLQLLLHGLVKFLLTQTHVSISISDICVLLIGTGGGRWTSWEKNVGFEENYTFLDTGWSEDEDLIHTPQSAKKLTRV